MIIIMYHYPIISSDNCLISIIIPKTKEFGCVGRRDLTFLFKSYEMYESQGRLI